MTVFTAALDYGTAEERAAYLDRVCGDSPDLRDRVEALLRAHRRGGHFLGASPPDQTATFVPSPGPGLRSSSRVYERADTRLFEAKRRGKNRVVAPETPFLDPPPRDPAPGTSPGTLG